MDTLTETRMNSSNEDTMVSAPYSIALDARGQLVLSRPGTLDVVDVRVRRAFPWSLPDQFISIRGKDGKELLMIEDLAAAPQPTRDLLAKTLAETSFIPRISRILSVDVRFGFQQWQVETDRGPAEFRVQEREDIRFMNDGRFSVKDVNGNLYEMAPLDKLDEHSQRAVERLL